MAARKRKKRGCGKRNWSRGPQARWKCKRGKKFTYAAATRRRKARKYSAQERESMGASLAVARGRRKR